MGRLSRECTITEKIDGTNAQIAIISDVEWHSFDPAHTVLIESFILGVEHVLGYRMVVGSRTRYLTPGKGDNYGFAGWAQRNIADLWELGPGRHFGEWWGQGIQRNYGLTERRFSLFNTARWAERYAVLSAKHDQGLDILEEGQQMAPACCHVVPVLFKGLFQTQAVETALAQLGQGGSVAAPGFKNPEGVVIFHAANGTMFKKTLDGDGAKGQQAHA
jgi:hypothetical protein